MKKTALLLVVFLCLMCIQAYSQEVYQPTDRWGTSKGQCIAVIENNKVYKGEGIFCTQGQCVYIIEGGRVFKSLGSFCTIKGDCVFVEERGYFYQSSDAWGNFVDNVLLVKQGNAIFAGGNGVGQGRCLYIIEDNKVFNSMNGSSYTKDDCVLILEGNISDVILLAILARRF